VAGVGGVIMSPGGTIELLFAWGLGISSNNTAEVYALLQGLRLAIESSISWLIVVGDLKTIIGKMVLKIATTDNLLASVIEWAKKEVLKLIRIKFFQVLRKNNQIADGFANQATLLKEGVISINSYDHNLSIP